MDKFEEWLKEMGMAGCSTDFERSCFEARQPEIDIIRMKWGHLDKLTTEQYGKIKELESKLAISKMNTYAFENLTRKLNEANSRIVEFEDIKKGHLAFIKEKNKEIEALLKRKSYEEGYLDAMIEEGH